MSNKTSNYAVEEVKLLITAHDLTHAFSDDRLQYTRGAAEYRVITSLMTDMEEASKVECRKHWNDCVRDKIAPGFVDEWLIQEHHNDSH